MQEKEELRNLILNRDSYIRSHFVVNVIAVCRKLEE